MGDAFKKTKTRKGIGGKEKAIIDLNEHCMRHLVIQGIGDFFVLYLNPCLDVHVIVFVILNVLASSGNSDPVQS